jgi:hypothetical protein
MCCIGFFTLPISIVGLVLGLVGLAVGQAETRSADPWAVTGTVINVIAFFMPFLAPHLFVGLTKIMGH